MIQPRKQDGFTLVELIVAMAFFSFVMLFVIVGFVQINRAYTRGIITKEVQGATRDLMDDITRAIRDADSINNSYANFLCIGTTRYVWNQTPGTPPSGGDLTYSGGELAGEFITAGRTVEPGPACNGAVSGSSTFTEQLLPDSLMVQYLLVDQIGTSDSYRVVLTVSTNSRDRPDDFRGDTGRYGEFARCDVKTGDQFCFASRLETVVTLRN